MQTKLGYLRRAAAAAAIVAVGCEGAARPTAPTPNKVPLSGNQRPLPPPASTPGVSGTVWVHTAEGVKPFANQKLDAWIETDRGGYAVPYIPIDAAGRYRLSVPDGASRVRIKVAGAYQPCAVTLTPQGDLTHDIHVVTDPLQLGARLPAELASVQPALAGTVYEITGEGRQPLKDVRLELDGLYGLGLPIASTLTGPDGRYVLCGMPQLPGLYLYAIKEGYQWFETGSNLLGQATLDIELRR